MLATCVPLASSLRTVSRAEKPQSSRSAPDGPSITEALPEDPEPRNVTRREPQLPEPACVDSELTAGADVREGESPIRPMISHTDDMGGKHLYVKRDYCPASILFEASIAALTSISAAANSAMTSGELWKPIEFSETMRFSQTTCALRCASSAAS